MTENKDLTEIEKNFNEASLPEIRRIFNSDLNEYTLFLKKALKKDSDIHKQLAVFTEYGISRMQDDVENFALADYFFVLSEIKGLPDEIHSFFTDVMVYCEDRMVNFTNISQIREYYNKEITPLL